ncbi:MAG: UDP-N-acetylmuramoyl-tripeptide--D-alanyl-D-alanine ligase [Clostridia bacterium]|nr:UDP-N-acetylmuramoyl-tripeptide--D-alanyl-D-alanine ligase [Clostridia bacterium]
MNSTFLFQLLSAAEGELASVPVPLGFDSWTTFWMVIFISVLNAVLMTFVSYKFFQALQLSGYRIRGYFSWLKESKFSDWGRLIILSFLSTAALLITNVLLEDFIIFKIMTYLGLVFYAIFTICYIVNVFNVEKKSPLKYTKRMRRMLGVFAVLVAAITMLLLMLSVISIPYFTHGIIGLTPMLVPILVLVAFFITWPFETLHNKKFVSRAKKKLEGDEFANLIKIGITGSYGKTSVKNILMTILSEKFKVVSSPYSYNTPLGLSKTILEDLKPSTEVLIAEMGARYLGDIKELSELVSPSIGLLTGLGNQHLGTFKTKENLTKTKFELADYVWANGGKMYFSGDCEAILAALEAKDHKGEFGLSGGNNGDVKALNVAYDKTGSKFTLATDVGKIDCKTSLLGVHNISNILLAASVALGLGLTLEEIKSGIEKLVPVAHRLALVPASSSLTVIDDAYNGSVEGAKAGLDVLSMFEGKKFVVTPGLVELGGEQFNSNFEFGIEMAKVVDYCIVTGITNYDAISSGLEFGGFDKSHILRAGSVSQAVELVGTLSHPGDVCLFENDLPDNYI